MLGREGDRPPRLSRPRASETRPRRARPERASGSGRCRRRSGRAGGATSRAYSPPVPIRIVLAEDHYLVREGVRRLLDAQPGFEVAAVCGDLDSLLEAVDREAPGRRGHRCPDATRSLRRRDPGRQTPARDEPGPGRRRPEPVRGPELRRRPAGHRQRRARLRLEGARPRSRPAPDGHQGGLARRLADRPDGGRTSGGGSDARDDVAAQAADRPGTRGPAEDGRGHEQRRRSPRTSS